MQTVPTADTAGQLADELLQLELDQEPVMASLVGLRDREDRLPDYTEAAAAELSDRLRDLAARTDAVDPAPLTDEDRLTRSVVQQQIRGNLEQLAARQVEYTITDSMFAPANAIVTAMSMLGLTEPAHANGYLARLERLPDVLAAITDRHRAGVAAGRLPVRRLVEAIVSHLDRHLADPDADPLRRPEPPAGVPGFEAERDRLLAEVVRPALGRYRDVLAAEVAPRGRPEERPGLCWLPDGEAYYAGLVLHYTTTDRSPEELHQVGLDVVAQLAEEYAQVGAAVFGTGEVAAILDRLRTDPALRWRDRDEPLAAARTAVRRAAEAAPAWFGRLPGPECIVEPVPENDAPGAPPAYYAPPALDGSRPGTYYVNTHDAEQRHRYLGESTAFHEGVPGHHFQLALAQELTDLPLLRRLGSFTAYAEGWGLYAERLADEMGLYSDGVARLGMLSNDSTRAARLVVDTGLHAMGWSRQQVVAYLRANTTMPEVEINTETDRYISAPGQALSYMVGRLEIQRIRAAAERALGDRFDIRGFHDVVLGSGGLPLTVLDEQVRAWWASRSAGSGS